MAKDIDRSVLIIACDKADIVALMHILGPGCSVHLAKNGMDGIELAEKYTPDLIILDTKMPDTDCGELLLALKSAEATKDTPVVFVTESGDHVEVIESFFSLGAAEYTSKPFCQAAVRARLEIQMNMLNMAQRIEQLTVTDQLTGIPNRRSFDARLEMEWGRALRERAPISILKLELDGFRNFNETHGIQQGDVALQTFARTFPSLLKRHGDLAARWSGDEFVALLVNTGSSGALHVAEMIRKGVEGMEIPGADGLDAKLSVSIGVNTRTHGENCSIDEFFAAADLALFSAKKLGGNRVCSND